MRSLVALLILLAPAHALAWADATVRSARARVVIDENAHAHVAIDATLRIEGGWLEALELDGLDPGLVLDALDPVTMAPAPSADGLSSVEDLAPLEPTVTLRDDGVLVLSFTRRNAPRRGDYVVHLAYDAELAGRSRADTDGIHVSWTFPAWRHGLDSVRVDLEVPAGAEPVLAADDEIEVARRDESATTFFTLTRAHLARTREWPIEIVVPESAMASRLAMAAPPPTHVTLTSARERPRPPWQGGIALAIASVLAAVRVLRSRRIEDRERVMLRPLVPVPAPIRALACLALGAALMGTALVGEHAALLAVLALSILALTVSRGAPVVVPPKLGSFRHATTSIRRAARRARLLHAIGPDAWLDATAPAGLLLLGAFGVLVSRVPNEALGPALVALAMLAVVSLDGARISRPSPPLVALGRLLGFARQARVSLDCPPVALMPVVHLDVRGVAQEARIRVLTALPEGTLRADVVIARTGLLGTCCALLVVVVRGSAIDTALAADGAFVTLASASERIARLTPIVGRRIDTALARLANAVQAPTSTERTSEALTSAA